jgi:hypothetical protein
MTEPAVIQGFERARQEAIALLRRLADALEHASPADAHETMQHVARPLDELRRAAELALMPGPEPGTT